MATSHPLTQRGTPLRALDTTVEIETPEHVVFSCSLVGPARRAIAYLIDLLVRFAILFVIGVVLSLASIGAAEISGWKLGALLLLMFALDWGYFVACESIMSGRSVLRNLLLAADFLPTGYAIGLLTMALDPRFRRLGDWAADTIVIIEERPRLRDPIRLEPPPKAAELDQLPTHVDLPGPVVEALELFLRRAPELQKLREDELAGMLAPTYGARLNVRYKSASRFLGLLYMRAAGGKQRVR